MTADSFALVQAADRTGQVAERVLSNPAGGPEKSKEAAQKLADANAEVPRALASGARKVVHRVPDTHARSVLLKAAMQCRV